MSRRKSPPGRSTTFPRRWNADSSDSAATKILTSPGLLLLLVFAGGVLRSVQYFSRSSLSPDEAAVALNLAARPLSELFTPLDLAQVAPVGFLAIEKGLLRIFGRNELGLRLLPFLASLLSLVLFERLCRRILRGLALPLAVGSFALATGLIDYAAQLKQYSTDVAAAVAILLAAVELQQRGLTIRRALILGIAGLPACALSQSVVFVLAGIGLSLALLAVAGRIDAPLPAVGLLAFLWGLAAGLAVWSGQRMLTPGVKSYLEGFWASGFMPLSPPAAAPSWLWRQSVNLFSGFLDYPLPLLFVVLLAVGAVALFRRNRVAALYLLLPVLLALAASAARLYPFAPGRVTAFLVPGLLVLVAEGAERARRLGSGPLAWIGAAVAIVAVACPVWAVVGNPPPYMQEHVRPALERLRSESRPGDALYVHYGARLPYLFYEPVLAPSARERVLGKCAREDPRSYLRQLDTFRGRARVWILLAHDLPVFGEGRLILDYLDRIGRPLERADFRFHGGSYPIVLAAYDLSDPARLSAANSEAFPVADPPKAALAALPCEGTMGPARRSATAGQNDDDGTDKP